MALNLLLTARSGSDTANIFAAAPISLVFSGAQSGAFFCNQLSGLLNLLQKQP